MMRVLVTAALICASVPVGAQMAAPDALAVQALHNYAGCIVERSPKGVAQLLDLDFRTAQYGDRVQRLARGHSYCAPGGRLRFRSVLFAGALAEHLLESRFTPAQLPKALAAVPNPPPPARDETEMMALCTVRTAPGEVAELLKQPVTSAEEGRAMQALAPRLTACLAAGQSLKVNRAGLRSVLALAGWRVAKGRTS